MIYNLRNVPTFNRFLEIAAITNGEIVNYSNIAKECGISSPTVKEYFQILEDTLLGRFIPAFQKTVKRRLIAAPRFLFFDLGIVNILTRRGIIEQGSELFGRAFEHFIFLEVMAHRSYSEKYYSIAYWRTASQLEVDMILGDGQVAVEIKSASQIQSKHLKGLRAFQEEHPSAQCISISLDANPRKTADNILILPWQEFLEKLWSNQLV